MKTKVRAARDPAAAVWTAQSNDVPGLITEAENLDGLMRKLLELVPVLLEANDGELPSVVQIQLHGYRLGMLVEVRTAIGGSQR